LFGVKCGSWGHEPWRRLTETIASIYVRPVTIMDYSIFKCPLTSEKLHLADLAALTGVSIPTEISEIGSFDKLLINDSKTYLYPIVRDILILLPQYAIYIGNENSTRQELVFDKKRVFDYYNHVDHIVSDSFKGYADLNKWIDQREVASEYFHITHARAGNFINLPVNIF
jgi:hypothetical protein